jgi:cytochrome P450
MTSEALSLRRIHASAMDPISAATASNPYPYYSTLEPFFKEGAFWVASSAAAVTEVFESGLCRVRPASEPVPKALLGTPIGEMFRQMARMNDGPAHKAMKAVLLEALGSANVSETAAACARKLAAGKVTDFAFQLSVHTMVRVLGLDLQDPAPLARDLARCIAPVVTPEQVHLGSCAWLELSTLLALPEARGGALFAALLDAAARNGMTEPAQVIANAIALLFQVYDATAGLIGNTLLALARHPTDPAQCRQAVLETLRWDAPVHNTRRFVVKAGTIAGQRVAEGEVILLLLAAANRDPLANPRADQFDLHREAPRVFSFGAGIHACPGRTLAVDIATAGVRQLLLAGTNLEKLASDFAYLPSPNVRVPLFGGHSRYA